ncbi:Uncharacterized protein DAT39_011603, partial [Clarias magur]
WLTAFCCKAQDLGICGMAVVCFLPRRLVILGDMDGIHICSMQTLYWCLTRLSTLSSSVLPLYPVS